MSIDCNKAVWNIQLKPATLKLTLLSLADRADNDGYRCYPSIERIARDTSLNKKTVQSNIAKLIEIGLITDTGKRVGASQRVRVFQLNLSNIQNWDDPENGMIDDPENGMIDDPENGMQNLPKNQPINQEDKNDRPTDQSRAELLKKSYEYLWGIWKSCKKQKGKIDTSPKKETFNKKWKVMFNSAYFKKHTVDEFKAEVNQMAQFCKEAHAVEGFNRFENMQLARFLSEKQWRD